jgi:Asp/Glu/hydantoin racemase
MTLMRLVMLVGAVLALVATGAGAEQSTYYELQRHVVGIAEASMRAAASGGRRFAVVTTTPGLVRRISERAERLGLGTFCRAVLTTEGAATALMRSPSDLDRSLSELAVRAVAKLDVEAIVVGGGPLGRVARALRDKLSVPVIEPIPEAIRHVGRRLGAVSGT